VLLFGVNFNLILFYSSLQCIEFSVMCSLFLSRILKASLNKGFNVKVLFLELRDTKIITGAPIVDLSLGTEEYSALLMVRSSL